MNNQPLISVIVPVYNTERYLKTCLDSLVNQTYSELEIILVDDGSSDSSAAICQKYVDRDKRIHLIQQPNGGVSHARNAGMKYAHGDYFSFIDSDDYLELDAYEYMIGLIREKNVDAVNYEHFVTYKDHEMRHRLTDENYGYFDRKGAQYQLLYNVQFACNKLFPREMICGLAFDESIFRGEDTLFSKMAFEKGNRFWFDQRPLYHYVQSENSAVRGKFRKSQMSVMKLGEICGPFYRDKYPQMLSGFHAYMSNQLICIYFDAWNDPEKLQSEEKQLYREFQRYWKLALRCEEISKKQKLKLCLFEISPKVFCLLHRMIWR